MPAPVFFFIAGESSGDILGARLMRALRTKLHDDVTFVGIGGPLMVAEGLEVLYSYTELMHFGVVEVLRHVPRLLKRIKQTADEIITTQPTALITIDSPDFCFRVAKRVKKQMGSAIPIIHYVAPTVWAWRPGRAKKIARFLDHLMVVLPFEPPYFTREGLDCTFVGHSIVEGNASLGSNALFRSARQISAETPLLTVLLGSRISEIERLLPVFRDAVGLLHANYRGLQILVPTVPHLRDRVAKEIEKWDIVSHIVEGDKDKYNAFAASRAAMACSGTVSLELALARLPSIIAYKINALTALVYRRFIRVAYVNLVNIMHGREVVPEFLQENCTAAKIAAAVDLLFSSDHRRDEQITQLAATAAWLGQGQFVPSERAADTVLQALRKHRPVTPRPMTVLQVLPSLVTGGVERGTVEITAALVRTGLRAIVASSGGPMVAEVEAAGGSHVTMPLASKNPYTMYKNIRRLANLIKAQKVDIVHARSRAPAWSASYAARRAEVPFLTTFHAPYGARSSLKRFYNSIMGTGGRVIAISNFVADYALAHYRIKKDRLRVIHRGVDIEQFDPKKVEPVRLSTLRRQWNVVEGVPVILMPGRLTRWKGQSVLIRALQKVERRDFKCVIVGGGQDSRYGKELLSDIRRAGLEMNVALFDTCRDMPAAYMLADLVVVPSVRPEGFGRVVTEAQAMGTPVVAADHGGARETIIDNVTGWLVEPGNDAALAHTLNLVLALTSEQRSAYAERSMAHIRNHFTTEHMASKTLAVYRELLHAG